MIVIDTHVLVWMIEGDKCIGRNAIALIEAERALDGVGIVPITTWELAMLVDKDRLVIGQPIASWFDTVLATPGYVLTPWAVSIGIDAGMLPGDIHGDPADRLIIATARALGCPVLTADRKILDYAASGHVQAIDARR
ncbi:type II toxin-antitoxin system VapC family toxin [Sphingomonas sp.]|uniref:type II toxin-antitoxin system VapC family toxin n=1 Tax=Sphingomonas sp. TaxID=28214 RepID=UPI003AFF67BC